MSELIPVFAGPSLWGCERQRAFCYRPPAQAGDLIALLARPPERMCLIDGLFDACAAPWHKELLLLTAAGTRIFGASSMGALRAAELDQFGMMGVGTIYQAYRDGRLSGDDEVALAHGPQSWGWRPLTVPMVELRATLISACRRRLLDPASARLARQRLHDIHYDRRDWTEVERACTEDGLLTEGQARALQAAHVPLKKLDALRCLEAALRDRGGEAGASPPITPFIRELAASRGVASALLKVSRRDSRTAPRPPPPETAGAT